MNNEEEENFIKHQHELNFNNEEINNQNQKQEQNQNQENNIANIDKMNGNKFHK